MSSCLALAPVKACGTFGNCINSSCVCDDGYTQGEEFSYFEGEYCHHNEGVIRIFCILNLTGATIVLGLQLNAIKSRRQLYRSTRFLLAFSLTIVFSIIRLTDANALFGVDVLFTFVFTNALALMYNGSVDYYQRYLKYLAKDQVLINIDKNDARWLAKYLSTFQYIVLYMDLPIFQLWWISALIEEKKAAIVLVRLVLAYILFRYILITMSAAVETLFINDMKRVIAYSESSQGIKVQVGGIAESRLIANAKYRLPIAIRLRNISIVWSMLTFPGYVAPLLWDLALQNGAYLLMLQIPVYCVLFGSFAISGILFKYRNKKYLKANMLSNTNLNVALTSANNINSSVTQSTLHDNITIDNEMTEKL